MDVGPLGSNEVDMVRGQALMDNRPDGMMTEVEGRGGIRSRSSEFLATGLERARESQTVDSKVRKSRIEPIPNILWWSWFVLRIFLATDELYTRRCDPNASPRSLTILGIAKRERQPRGGCTAVLFLDREWMTFLAWRNVILIEMKITSFVGGIESDQRG